VGDRFRLRVTRCNKGDVRRNESFVLYWMSAFRRPRWNLALERAVFWARELDKPLVVLEALRCDYPWACDRFHRFILDGMAHNRKAFEGRAFYFPFVEREKGEGKGLVAALATRSAVVVTDEYPCFFLPRMAATAAARLFVSMEKVDSNGLLPMRAADKAFGTAYSFRRLLQKDLPRYLRALPRSDPLEGLTASPICPPDSILRRWPLADLGAIGTGPESLAGLPIDHSVPAVGRTGGAGEAERILRRFVEEKLHRYAADRNDPLKDATSGLSPYLHFGHISAAEIFHAVAEAEGWSLDSAAARTASGARRGWWQMSEAAEAFLDQLVTWRELGFNMCFHNRSYDRYESLPPWARDTLESHAKDRREYLYDLSSLEEARTHDEVWNAAQGQLLIEGGIHNYLRMLWGKKILEWSAHPKEALFTMIELNNKYGLDGRDPNSYSGIFWVLGRYDRPWGPERPIFGKVRYMSSESTARKIPLRDYIKRYAGGGDRPPRSRDQGRAGVGGEETARTK